MAFLALCCPPGIHPLIHELPLNQVSPLVAAPAPDWHSETASLDRLSLPFPRSPPGCWRAPWGGWVSRDTASWFAEIADGHSLSSTHRRSVRVVLLPYLLLRLSRVFHEGRSGADQSHLRRLAPTRWLLDRSHLQAREELGNGASDFPAN